MIKRHMIEGAAETVLARYRDTLPRPLDEARRDAAALLHRRRRLRNSAKLRLRTHLARMVHDISTLRGA